MTTIKVPRSLRGVAGNGFSGVERQSNLSVAGHAAAGMGLAAVVCLISVEPGLAQTTTLPAVTVEAPAAPKARKRPQRQARPAVRPTRPANAPARAAAPQQAAPVQAGPSPAANANPYANPGAPYKIERSSSNKLTEPLINTPRSVTVVPKEVLEDKGATSLRELVRTTPGLTLGSGEGGNAFGDRVFIRGFDARNDMYINGVRDSGVTTRETFMAEQVEIIKGPAGSIAGRGTSGGAINVVTKQALDKNFYSLAAVGGTDLTRRLTADLNHNVNKDFAVRLGGLFQQANVAGRSHVFDDRYGGSIATSWKPTETFKLSFDYYYLAMDQMPDWGVPFDPRTRRPFTESGLRRSNFYGVTSRDFQRNSQHMATSNLEWKVTPDITVTSKIRYGYTTTDYVASKPGTPNLTNPDSRLWTVAATPASRYQINRVATNQTDATFKFDLFGFKNTLVTGVEISREDISQDGYSGLEVECNPACTTGITTNLWNPTTHLVSAVGTPVRNGRPAKTKVDTISGYFLNTANWNDKLFLNYGARLDGYSISRTPFGAATLARDDLMFNYNVGLTYKVLPNASIYAAYATSTNPVGSELDAGADAYGGLAANNVVFKPEKNTSFEVGTKWEFFDKKLLLTASAFQTTKDNAREQIGALLYDTAAYRVRGLDFGVSGNITERWSVFGGIVLMQSEMTKSQVASNIGLPLANIAHQSINLLTKYKLTDKLTVGGQATWKGEILGGTLQATRYTVGTVNVGGVAVPTPSGYNKLPGGWRFDLLAEYEIDKTFSVKVQVQNIFDKVLYDAFYRSSTPYVYLAPGRAGYVTVNAKF
jgi:catecholate siderophore receptor